MQAPTPMLAIRKYARVLNGAFTIAVALVPNIVVNKLI